MGILGAVAKSLDNKEIKKLEKTANKIEALADEYAALSDEDLQHKTIEFKERLQNGETLDDLLVEAFATVREASTRILGLRHFKVQLIGGIILHQGNIAEMKTGEGKTLMATLPAYLNALEGKGVHIVTVNDYLAKRDSEWNGKMFNFLGLSVGLIVHGLDFEEKKNAYNADITYGTNNEFGFDYLRDNMVKEMDDMVQRDLNFSIVDEVDSILIDEARTPLIISGSGNESTKRYYDANAFIKTLKEDDYAVDEKDKTCNLTEKGIEKAERAFNIENLSDINNMELQHHINQALRANTLMFKDRDYVVRNGEVLIVDEFTGRIMEGRRYSEGLHQAIEAKEGVKVERESVTLATITFQNYFRMYNKLAGMTGTAKTEEEEFKEIYNMNVLQVPTNKPLIREDMKDAVFTTKKGKEKAIINEIKERHAKGQPVLVGTIAIEDSEKLSKLLKREGIKHNVLNAKFHEKEAEIIADAGQMGAVTISTNMAGRGTDIVLGEGVKELGGLHILGTERHESRRIDNQLRGRAGRQGDPGSSQFFISLEDDLMRLFGGERIQGFANRTSLEEDEALESRMLTKTIENAQKQIEGKNFGIRKYVLQYDDVMNKQREVIYAQRKKVLKGEDVSNAIREMIDSIIENTVEAYTTNEHYTDNWNLDKIEENIFNTFGLIVDIDKNISDKETLKTFIIDEVYKLYKKKEEEFSSEELRELERLVLLKVVDSNWMEHIDNMDQLKQGINLRAYGQIDPVQAYTKEGFEMFEEMNEIIKEDTVKYLFHMEKVEQIVNEAPKDMYFNDGEEAPKKKPVVNKNKIGRNDPCPCGSGKKYKKCCGKNK
ncbi:preprotein translocase subunit SecA [Anaerofustis sp.]|uniref:preprotein translocase subunit SecA n=1 Tax=Anaerofustis sp. TaxID=1872517 RepID=UPI0025B979DD|nr:preprotein translocase subunit SecA [Anaerofustis sp.]